ncbi:hypothetical protein BURK2_01561 [Burkholderiales bacterium]|nr:hypothetical protein BURK2_01561 [Burkholderiales bacterium]
MKRSNRFRRHALLAATALFAVAALPASVYAQDYGAMVQQSMNRMNQIINNAQQGVNTIVQQRMYDPQVQASYRHYLARAQAHGQPAMDYPTYTYNYVYTRGFSREGTAVAQANEAGIRANERAAVNRLRQAEAQRGAAQQQHRDGYFANQQEAGRGLMGQSTFRAGNGAQVVLPHTWQANTYHEYQGNTYHVNASGQYFVRASDGWWYPLAR